MERPPTAMPRIPRLLYAAVAVEALGYGGIFALLADLQDRYGLPTYGLGLIGGASFLAGLVAQVSLARYADRGYTRLLLRGGLAVAAVGMLWFGLATHLWEFIGARVLLGLGSGVFIPATRRVVVSRAGDRSGEALGRLASVEVGGFIAGPPIAALIAGLFGLHVPFIVFAAALAITSPAVARLEEPPVEPQGDKRVVRVLLRRRGVLAGLSLGAALFLSIGVFDAMWARYMSDLGASTAVVAVTLALFALPLVALSPFGGRIADRQGPVRSAVLALIITVPVIIGYGVTDSIVVACVLALVHSFCDAVTTPAGQAAVARGAPASLAAAGQGLYGAVGAAAAAFAAFGAAPLYGAAGPETMWAVCAALVAALALAAFLFGRGTTVDEPR
jgi:MFS family permease